MDLWRHLLVAVLLLEELQGAALATFTQATWRRVFTVDVVISGYTNALTTPSLPFCMSQCLHHDACVTFAFRSGSANATCWLYGDLVEFSQTGVAAPGTSYFWRQAASCPADFREESGLCFKVVQDRQKRPNSTAHCRSRGAHLFVANSPEKRQMLLQDMVAYGRVYLGATNLVGGQWRWVDGSPVSPEHPPWAANEPSGGGQTYMAMTNRPDFDDVDDGSRYFFVCQIPI